MVETNFFVGYITVPNYELAENISKQLLSKKLIACANIIPSIKSVFKWENELKVINESLIMIKTLSDSRDAIINEVNSLHSYELPEVIFTPISSGNSDYLNWVRNEIN